MNHSYLMKHISYHLHTYVRRYTIDYTHIQSFCGRIPFQDCFTPDELMSFFTSREDISFDHPSFLSVNQKLLYVLVPTIENYFIIGPVQPSDGIYLRYQTEVEPIDEAWIQTIPICSLKDLMTDVLLVFNLYREETLDKTTLLTTNCINPETDAHVKANFSELIFENREN